MKHETPNYPKEIEAKMTKEKPLSEKARTSVSLWVYKEEDVALAVKRLKEELDDKHVTYWINKIMGEFK